MAINFLNLFIIISAVYRVSSLFANENGPFYMFLKFRNFCAMLCEKYPFCRELHLYELVECELCNSIWLGALFAVLWALAGNMFVNVCLVLCISTWVIVIKYLIQLLQNSSIVRR